MENRENKGWCDMGMATANELKTVIADIVELALRFSQALMIVFAVGLLVVLLHEVAQHWKKL